MLALLNGPNVVTQYFWIALLCSQSTGGSCGYPDIYERLFVSQAECEQWLRDEWLHGARYAKTDCKEVRYTIDIGHPYEGASEFYKSMIK